MKHTTRLQERDLYWIAGLFEGEASFYPMTDKYPLGFQIEMTDLDVIEKICNIIGTKYCLPKIRESHHKQSYRTTLRGLPALNIMIQILPIMGNRRTIKIQECIQSYLPKKRGKLTESQINEIRLRGLAGEKAKNIAVDYDVSFWRVYQLIR